jgi:arsenite methyltransferase
MAFLNHRKRERAVYGTAGSSKWKSPHLIENSCPPALLWGRPPHVQLANLSTVSMSGAAEEDATRQSVSKYYGEVLQATKNLKTSAACCSGAPHPVIAKIFEGIPTQVTSKFYGCGAPLPLGVNGLRFLDLGSGSGRDCYAAASLVGEHGNVIGVDMTEEQLSVACAHADEYCCKTLGYGKSNMSFKNGVIEKLTEAGIAADSFDICMSNCVVNLSPDKPAVLREVFRALASGGEFYFADVYSDSRLSDEVREHQVLWGECIAGALKVEDFEEMARVAGFCRPLVVSVAPIDIYDTELRGLVGKAQFYSITYRLFKLQGAQAACAEGPKEEEEEELVAVSYKGSIAGMEDAYTLDIDTRFHVGEPVRVDTLTGRIMQEGWLKSHFDVTRRGATHFARTGARRDTRALLEHCRQQGGDAAAAC